jgi:hypothetical protein
MKLVPIGHITRKFMEQGYHIAVTQELLSSQLNTVYATSPIAL